MLLAEAGNLIWPWLFKISQNQMQSRLGSSRAWWPMVPNFCSRATCFFMEIICWAHWISQVQSTGLPSIFLRAKRCQYLLITLHMVIMAKSSPLIQLGWGRWCDCVISYLPLLHCLYWHALILICQYKFHLYTRWVIKNCCTS